MCYLQLKEHMHQYPKKAIGLAEAQRRLQDIERLLRPAQVSEDDDLMMQGLGQRTHIAQTACQFGRALGHGQRLVQSVLVVQVEVADQVQSAARLLRLALVDEGQN